LILLGALDTSTRKGYHDSFQRTRLAGKVKEFVRAIQARDVREGWLYVAQPSVGSTGDGPDEVPDHAGFDRAGGKAAP